MNRQTGSLAALMAAGVFASFGWAFARPQNHISAMKSGHAMRVAAADKKFAMKAAQGGIAEVQAGKLAADKATTDEWKKFGQQMVDDHTAANEKLKTIADSKGITLPTSPAPKDAATIAKLGQLGGAAFDKAYKKFALASHDEAHKLFMAESQTGKDADLKQFAKDTLPTIVQHHTEAGKMAGKMSGK